MFCESEIYWKPRGKLHEYDEGNSESVVGMMIIKG
jgi:hypothetical protein